ncbi:MAG TPA: protein kinase, partial [Polyangia bacterium]|nr:protein kinase [Polyangia bacterium]
MDEFDQNPPSETGDRTSKTEETGTVPGTEPPLPASDEAHAASLRPLLATTLPIVQREHYAIEGERDRGGLGRILQGRDRRLDRPVAIKQLLTHDSQARARFVREALVSARLQHPAIVPVYEAGRWPDGEPFYAMKLISGRSLKEIVDEALSLDQRLALMPHILAVADAMAYAHEQRVIHRDLKPSNVLVGRFGETVVIDWGLAKDLGRAEASEEESWDNPYDIATHDLTVDGSVMGTPHYMPPEQGRGEPVDERADVYAIGAMLYHLLAGTPPYTGDKSTEVVERLLAGPPLPLEERQPGVPMDLAAIVRKAMARAKEERYPSARELAEDLHRFHTGQLVAAHEYSRWTLAGRWLKRHRLPVAVAGLALIVLCLEGWLAVRRIVHERNRAEQQRTDAEQQRRHAEAQRNRVILEQARGLLERDPTATLAVLKTYPRDAADRRTVRELILMAQSTGVARHVFRGDLGNLCDGDFSPDGKLYASSGYGRVLSIWDVDTGRVVQQWPVQQPVYGIRFSPDGERLAYIGPRTHHLFLRSLRTGVERTLAVEGQGLVNDFAFSPRGDWILILTDAQSLYVRPMAEGKPRVLDHHESTSTASAFSPDGQWIAYAGDDRSIRLYELASGRVRSLRGHGAAVTALAFTREGRLASASRDGTARIWDPASGASLRILRGHRASVRNLAFSPDGRRLATGGEDETVRIWDVATGAEEGLERHEGRVNTLAFSPDGRYLTWAGAGSIVHLRDLVTQESRTLLGHRAEIGRVHFSSDGRYLASNSNDKTARLWALPPSRSRILLGHQGNIQSAKFSPDGKVLATASRD